jgi:hypothetical protein
LLLQQESQKLILTTLAFAIFSVDKVSQSHPEGMHGLTGDTWAFFAPICTDVARQSCLKLHDIKIRGGLGYGSKVIIEPFRGSPTSEVDASQACKCATNSELSKTVDCR